ncbi:MAG TPA: peptidoglycan-binding domain-containing protein, partial [Myxococcota bacterium]|nr:peptidoglycan-binding domain-containing protein [Myxococcota bacterium]
MAVVGRQIFELLCFDAYPGDGVANVWVTGRVRLLAWAYGLPVMVWPRPLQRTAEAKEVRVARIGLRQRGLRAAAEPTQCRGTWSVAGRPREIFLLDVSKGQDLDEVVALLDALGYTQPAVEPGQTGVGGPLTVRLRVFQHMNDLPPTGDLDPDTLFRLLHLDLAQRNIAAPRPFDPARWAAIAPAPPPREETRTVERIENILVLHTLPETPLDHGDIPLVNPDADQYAAEGIRLVTHPGPIRTGQKKACTYYICAAKMGAEEAIFPSDIKKGWIPHQADDDWLFQEKEKRPPALGCSFVGLASRAPLAGDKTGFEGGELSEGAAFQPGR